MKIQITLEAAEEIVDPGDDTGLTEEAFEEIQDALMNFGEDIRIEKVEG